MIKREFKTTYQFNKTTVCGFLIEKQKTMIWQDDLPTCFMIKKKKGEQELFDSPWALKTGRWTLNCDMKKKPSNIHIDHIKKEASGRQMNHWLETDPRSNTPTRRDLWKLSLRREEVGTESKALSECHEPIAHQLVSDKWCTDTRCNLQKKSDIYWRRVI